MNRPRLCAILAAMLSAFAPAAFAQPAADKPQVFDIPRMEGIIIDGNADDWGGGGFRVEMMNHRTLDGVSVDNFDPRYRLGWDERGLLVLLNVRDDLPLEKERARDLWQWDNVQITVAPAAGGKAAGPVVTGPGADPARPGIRTHFDATDTTAPAIDAKSMVTSGSYVMEVLVPWSALENAPKRGDRVKVTVAVSDIDDEKLNMWFAGLAGNDTREVRLALKPSPPVTAFATGSYERLKETRVWVFATGEPAGRKVRVFEGAKRIAEGALRGDAGRAATSFTLEMPPVGGTWGKLTAQIAGQAQIAVPIADAGTVRGQRLVDEEIAFAPGFVFTGEAFPKADFEHAFLAESLIGPYSVKTTFYDKDYHVVTTASQPGRYGAVVEITPEKGRVTRRLRTVMRLPDAMGRETVLSGTLAFPGDTGFTLSFDSATGNEVGRALRWQMVYPFLSKPFGAPLLAAAHERRGDPSYGLGGDDPWSADRQWWVTLKRKLYGTDKEHPAPFVSPRPIAGKPAPVLHEGTLEEAGIKPDALKKLDALLEEWAADSDEGFAVCLARHGVIAHHKAYGSRDGTSMTVTTPSWMASITKLMSASLMLQLVDQGLVDMDAPVAQYLPMMRCIPVEKPITVRNLYTHTGGLWGHWGDEMHDMEERVADYYRFLGADTLSAYNGAGNSLGSKIIEAITGEALPAFFRKHLLDPLGVEHSHVADSSGGTRSVPLDMAKIGQMLLNRGAYGDMRFFSEATADRQLPAPLVKQFGPGTTLVKGFGMQWFTEQPLGKRVMSHGAASSATFCVDLDNDLVLVMCRNAAGKNFDKYFPRFIAAVRECITDPK